MSAPRADRSLTRILARLLLALTLVTVASLAIVVAGRRPSLEREWDEDVRVLAGAGKRADGVIELRDVRAWRYTREQVVAKHYVDVEYRPADVVDLWLYEQELGLFGTVAHVFLVFEFPETYGDDRWLGLSVETRREVGETYSLIGGVMRAFELTHIWAREDDLVRRRVEHLDYPLTRFRLTVPDDLEGRIFEQFVDETAALAKTPRWYNTLTTNCTNSLITYVNRLQPDAIPWSLSYYLTGLADEHLAELGYLETDSAVHITREWLASERLR